MSDLFSSLWDGLSGNEFVEIPVTLDVFMESDEYLAASKISLSEHQKALVNAMTQIYREDTLIMLYGEVEGRRRFKETCKEVIMRLGKGSGKDLSSTVAVTYLVYLLLCLKDPATYFGKPKGDTIDIINIAINADQANRVFFKNLVQRVRDCKWMEGKFDVKAGSIEFDKNVTVYSGHSEREAFEGYNTIMVILDEISGFALESASGNEQAKTAPAIYKMYKGSITSRFPEIGKLVLLSFPRFDGDFISQKYDEAIAEKEVIDRSVTVKIDPELPDGIKENEFDIKWPEDHITRYNRPKVFALTRPSWEVNPTKSIYMYVDDFHMDYGDAMGRFACVPNNVTGGFFKNQQAIDAAFSRMNGVDQAGVFHPQFLPEKGVRYFVHVDLAQKHDHCAVALAHVAGWKKIEIGSADYVEYLPVVVVDAIRWWTPTKEQSVDFKDVVNYIIALRRRGFDIKLATFDRWNSHDTMQNLERLGINTDVLSVAKKHYDDFLVTMYDSRLIGPAEELLTKELKELRLIKDKVDHPRKGSKDLSDAVCGAIFDAVTGTPHDENREVDVLTLSDVKKMIKEEQEDKPVYSEGVIRAPKVGMPKASAPEDILDLMRLV